MATPSDTCTADKQAPPTLQIRMFGPFTIRVEGMPIPPLRVRKDAWLLALLVLRHHHPVDRLWLAATLWPDSDEAVARKNLRHSLHQLRRALGAQDQRLQSPRPGTLSLDLTGAEVDLITFDAALAKGDAPDEVVRLYSGPLLEGCLEEWVVLERERRQEAYLDALEALADDQSRTGEVGRAIQALRLCIGVDPLRETARRNLMAALADTGDYAGAMQVYREFRLLLHEKLQAQPSALTLALDQQIRAKARQLLGAPARSLQPSTPSEARSTPEPPHNLPPPLTSFVGREREIARVKSLLAQSGLLTLTGSGGCGKTRLALLVASEVRAEYPDGVWLVEFASLSTPGLVPQAVASVFQIREPLGIPLTETLTRSLKGKRLLLILDNCEHLLASCADLALALRRACPEVGLLATSRERLGIAGEQIYRVPSLSVPGLTEAVTTVNACRYDSVRLFIARASLVDSEFAVRDDNILAVVQICQRLDGIPLAIELAAARTRALSVAEINARLDTGFRLLIGSDRAALPRHQTLRALIDWSYGLLSAQERLLLQMLSVFAGGWTLAAAESVCGGKGRESIESSDDIHVHSSLFPDEVLDLLISLVDKNLVIVETQRVVTRYRLLETVRQYAREQLAEVEANSRQTRERHRDYFLSLAEGADLQLRGPEQALWLAVLEEEHDNLRQALTFCMEEPDEGQVGLRLAATLQWFWVMRGHLSEGRERLAAVLAHRTGHERTKARADCLSGAGLLAGAQGDYAISGSLHAESLAIRRELGDKQGISTSLNDLGNVAYRQGDYASARPLYEEGLEIRRELGDEQGIAASLSNVGNVAHDQGDYVMARALQEESLGILQRLGDKHRIASLLGNLGTVAIAQGDLALAGSRFKGSLEIQRQLGNRQGIALALLNLGRVAHAQGEYAEACSLYEESLTIRRELGDKQGVAYSLNGLGRVAHARGDRVAACALHEESLAIQREILDRRGIANTLHNLGLLAHDRGDYVSARSLHVEGLTLMRELGMKQSIADSLEAFASLALAQQQKHRAVGLWGAATALRDALGSPLPPNERSRYDRELAAAREALGEVAFAAIWEEGRLLTRDRAVAYALGE